MPKEPIIKHVYDIAVGGESHVKGWPLPVRYVTTASDEAEARASTLRKVEEEGRIISPVIESVVDACDECAQIPHSSQ